MIFVLFGSSLLLKIIINKKTKKTGKIKVIIVEDLFRFIYNKFLHIIILALNLVNDPNQKAILFNTFIKLLLPLLYPFTNSSILIYYREFLKGGNINVKIK